MSQTDAVKATNDDATLCKRWAVSKGYWTDAYIQYFCRSLERKAPEISRGYYARVTGLKLLLDQFLKASKEKSQVVNLGCGFDTLFWRLCDDGVRLAKFIDVDFSDITSQKCNYVRTRKPLLEKITSEDTDIQFNRTDLHSKTYHLVGADLRHVQELEQKLASCDIDANMPTVFIAECVLVYMEVHESASLLSWITDKYPTAMFLNYEQVNMKDTFGEIMLKNLLSRGCSLVGAAACTDCDTQKDRFISRGWEVAHVWDMMRVYENLPRVDVERMQKLEFLDDVEVFRQLLLHYCICWAFKDTVNIGLKDVHL